MTRSSNDDSRPTTPGADEPTTGSSGDAAPRAALEELVRADARFPFGPRFFLRQLAAFVRERCPDPEERLPRVDLWVHGEPITVCHVMAIGPRWVAVAARADPERAQMSTEFIVYESIGRVTISGADPGSHAIGFDPTQRPVILDDDEMSPEETVAAAARAARQEKE